MSINLKAKWAVLDTETSGLSARQDRVISLAVVTLDENLEIEEVWSTLVDPGVDPGATHVHGITSEMLEGQPKFADVLDKLNSLLEGRVMVAHNVGFDHGFLRAEAGRAGSKLSHENALCTLRAARRLKVGSGKLTLGSLASYYGITQRRAHDALDDTEVLVKVWRRLHKRALNNGIELYALGEATPSKYSTVTKVKSGKAPCPFRNSGKYVEGRLLRQGMRVAFTGGDEALRLSLEEETTKRGMDVSGSVSSKTSLLVSDGSSSSKGVKALSVGCPIISFERYQELLEGKIRAGVPV